MITFFFLNKKPSENFIGDKEKKEESSNVNTSDNIKTDMEVSTTLTPDINKGLSNWKIYKNIQYSFEISYPLTWFLVEEGGGVTVKNYKDLEFKESKFPITIKIQYYKDANLGELSPQDYFLKENGQFGGFMETVKEQKEMVIGGQKALRVFSQADRSGVLRNEYDYVISRDKDIVKIGYIFNQVDLDRAVDNKNIATEVEKIVNSLKFISADTVAYSSLIEKERSLVAAPDADKDGVWDYIQEWIDKNYSDQPGVKKILRSFAKSDQLELLNYRDPVLIKKAHGEIFLAMGCLYEKDPNKASEIVKKFEMAMFNTEERRRALLAGDSNSQTSAVYGSVDEEVPPEYCNQYQ